MVFGIKYVRLRIIEVKVGNKEVIGIRYCAKGIFSESRRHVLSFFSSFSENHGELVICILKRIGATRGKCGFYALRVTYARDPNTFRNTREILGRIQTLCFDRNCPRNEKCSFSSFATCFPPLRTRTRILAIQNRLTLFCFHNHLVTVFYTRAPNILVPFNRRQCNFGVNSFHVVSLVSINDTLRLDLSLLIPHIIIAYN